MGHHILLSVVGKEKVHKDLEHDMAQVLENGKLVLDGMEQGRDDKVRVGDKVLVRGMLDVVHGTLASLEGGLAWRIQDHCDRQQHQNGHMFLCIH